MGTKYVHRTAAIILHVNLVLKVTYNGLPTTDFKHSLASHPSEFKKSLKYYVPVNLLCLCITV